MWLRYCAERGTEILTVSAGAAPGARARESEVAAGERHELRFELRRGGKTVIARILSSYRAGAPRYYRARRS